MQTNQILSKQFYNLLNTDTAKKTHLFNNRYENIYLPIKDIPCITDLILYAVDYLTKKSSLKNKKKLKAGFWFNLMAPGDVTTAHTHDDDQELFSAVYYITVPENSGDLVFITDVQRTQVTPKAGQFIFFDPSLKHEVTENNSSEERLSIGFNFGY